MKKQDDFATEILHSALRKQRILLMALAVSMMVNVVLAAVLFSR